MNKKIHPSKMHAIITCNNVDIKYKKSSSPIISNFSYKFYPGKIYAIIGSSGVGKTTLLSGISGITKISGGNIKIKNWNIESKKRKLKNYRQIHKCVSMSFQFPESQLFNDTVKKDLSFASKNFKQSKLTIEKSISKYLSLFGRKWPPQADIRNRFDFSVCHISQNSRIKLVHNVENGTFSENLLEVQNACIIIVCTIK